MEGMTDGPAQTEVDEFNWWHTFTFSNGVKARGVKNEILLDVETQYAFRYFRSGSTVLDVGAANGYFSIEAVRRGAKRVVALEKWGWLGDGFKQFELARRYLASEIEAVHHDVMDLRSLSIGKFDYVLFMGVLYHLKNPLHALEVLAESTLEHLVVETHIDITDYDRPAMIFYPGSELNADASNWWGPNVQCVTEMLKIVGFSRVEYLIHPLAPDRGFFYAFK
jgi:tRNA (mo5U34)-methyltransferase